jgi:hypothetical protein
MTERKSVDVTQVLKKMIANNKLVVRASNALAGDPDPGVVKTLKISYRIGRKTRSVTIREGEEISIPE